MTREARGGDSAVAEIQGLDGAFSFAELLLQRIWLRGDFDRARAICAGGESVRVLHPGRWNRLGGPDFLGATLEIGGHRCTGDVELHLRASDWKSHGHAFDPRYRAVILHVVLFPTHELYSPGHDNTPLPVLPLLPILHRSLEEYAEEDAVERLANHPLSRARETWLGLSRGEQEHALHACAASRWARKFADAQRRLARVGWREACHQSALEVLGYRFNRGPMLALATEFPLERWPEVARGDAVDALYESYAASWNRQAVRPANHPKARLRQYAAWTDRVHDWPSALLLAKAVLALRLGEVALDTVEFRRAVKMTRVWRHFGSAVCGNAIGGTRFLTLICDAFLPLLAAYEPESAPALERWWFHAHPGDIPETVAQILSALALTQSHSRPICHGLSQGFLGWCWREEANALESAACPSGRGT